jgi:hypothetical protein
MYARIECSILKANHARRGSALTPAKDCERRRHETVTPRGRLVGLAPGRIAEIALRPFEGRL